MKGKAEEISIASGSSSPTQSVIGRIKQKLSPKRSVSPAQTPLITSPPPRSTKPAQVERVFQYFDENGDGKISPEELQSCIRTIGGELTSTEAVTAVESIDSDGDGLLGIEDFAKLMTPSGEEEQDKDLREAFAMYEKEGSGSITPTSLNRMLGRLGELKTVEECREIIRTFDLNGDGVLSFEEFRVMMK